MSGSIFNAPSGTPSKKPAHIKEYPTFPEVGGMTSSSIYKNDLGVKRPSSAGNRSAPGTK